VLVREKLLKGILFYFFLNNNDYIVLNLSGPNDNVFIFFADHGAPGLIAFPGL
jgi:hypothetical protein